MGARLTDRVFDWLDRHAPDCGGVAVGYSGGGDSHALLCLLMSWAQARNVTVHALTVDHGLRPESAAEAEAAAATARRLGARSSILKWTGTKPDTGIQAAARKARHALLAQACARLGVSDLALAHTLDDQAETVWMRLQAGGGWRACAGMASVAPSPAWPDGRDLRLLRPLLDMRRADLRDYLTSRGETWIEDPSNDDARFTRIAVRGKLATLREAGFDDARLAGWSDQLRYLETVERGLVAGLIEGSATIAAWGGAAVSTRALADAQAAIRHRCVESLALIVSGRSQPARASAVRGLADAVCSAKPATGAGVRVFVHGDKLCMVRDPGALLGRVDRPGIEPVALRAGTPEIWDGRYEIETDLSDTRAEPLGRDYAGLPDKGVLAGVPGAARPGLLAIRQEGRVIALAGLMQNSDVRIRPLFQHRLASCLFPRTGEAWFDKSLAAEMTRT